MSLEFNEEKNVEIEAGTLWRYIMQDLEGCMTTPSFEMAIKPLGVRSFEKGILTLITNNSMWSKAIKEKFANDILRALRKYSRNPAKNLRNYRRFIGKLQRRYFKPHFSNQKIHVHRW